MLLLHLFYLSGLNPSLSVTCTRSLTTRCHPRILLLISHIQSISKFCHFFLLKSMQVYFSMCSHYPPARFLSPPLPGSLLRPPYQSPCHQEWYISKRSRVKCMSRSFTSLSPSCAAGDERCTHNKMPKAFGKCFMKYFHILATVNQLHSHVSQVLFRLCFSLLVKVNDLDSGFETRFHNFLRSASYSVTSFHCSLSSQISHVQSILPLSFCVFLWFCHWFPTPLFIHLQIDFDFILTPHLARNQDWLNFLLKYPLPLSPEPLPRHSQNVLFGLTANSVTVILVLRHPIYHCQK